MPLYRKKPVIIEAMQLTPLSIDEVEAFVGGDAGMCPEHARSACLVIATLGGAMHASMRDWIIKGVKGELAFFGTAPGHGLCPGCLAGGAA